MKADLVAYGRTNFEICELLGCDDLIYLPIQSLVDACLKARKSSQVQSFEVGVFTGNYVTGGQEEYLQKLCSTKGKSSKLASSIKTDECPPRFREQLV